MKNREFEKVDEYYEEVRAMLRRLERINEEFQREEGLEEDYLSPFNKTYELKNLVEKIKDDLLGYVVRKLNKRRCPNITIEIGPLRKELIEKFGELGFSMRFVSGYIGSHYVAHSESLSRREILDKARHLLPSIWLKDAYGKKKLVTEDIQDKQKLVLHAYLDSFYGNTHDALRALDKLIGIVLDNLPAAKVVDYDLADVFRGDPYSTHLIGGDSHIEKVRAYKNGKLFIYFKTEEKARRVAEALLK